MKPISFRNYLILHGIVSEKQLIEANKYLADKNEQDSKVILSLGEYLCEKHVLSEKKLCEIYCEITGYKIIDPESFDISSYSSDRIKGDDCRKLGFLPINESSEFIHIVMKDPTDLLTIQNVRQMTGKSVKVYLAYPSAINEYILKKYGSETTDKALIDMSDDTSDPASEKDTSEDEIDSGTIRFVNSIIALASLQGASDIHIEPWEKESVIRFRIDGALSDIKTLKKGLHGSIIARIKVMSNLDVSEKRIPQDGRCIYKGKEGEIDLRISTLPAVYGEKAVIRLLRKNDDVLDKNYIGLDEKASEAYDKLLKNNSGLILMVGPTGSGKSTTMLTMEKILNKRDVNIITLEDPVEFNVQGLTQVQINEKTGMSFARGLRAAMRQDPDVICVGEIRDRETAEIAMRAAITGHLVISTLHTQDCVSTFERLIDMGVPPFLIASSIIGIVSQRLVRCICKECASPYIPGSVEKLETGLDKYKDLSKIRIGKGCVVCNGQGFKGRRGIFEILVMNTELRRAISGGADYMKIREIADATGYTKLKDACIEKIIKGETTVSEYYRVLNTVE